MNNDELKDAIDDLVRRPVAEQNQHGRPLFERLLAALETGAVRAAQRDEETGDWHVNRWVKRGILLGFRLGRIVRLADAGPLTFFDNDTVPLQQIDGPARSVRIVPGGSAIRAGAYVGTRVTMMPPAFINVGAWVGDETMIDSHALVGSCAQVGDRVHVSAAAQIGGVLEPVSALPVIVEDEVFVGGNSGIYDGTLVQRRAIIGAGVVITASTPIYDLVRETVYRRGGRGPLTVPEGAVVVPGSRPARGDFASSNGLQLAVPVIVKYRDQRTDAVTVLEEALR